MDKIKNITVFLDIDGVLATPKQFIIGKNAKTYIKKYNVYPFDPKCVNVFNKIIDKFDFDIVVSSNWQSFFSLEQIVDIFKINGIKRIPIDMTTERKVKMSSSSSTDRVDAIRRYIRDNDIKEYMIIDDLDLSADSHHSAFFEKGFNTNVFVKCNECEGIKQSGIKNKITKILKKWQDI